MRGLKGSISLIIFTAAICLAMVGGSAYKKISTSSGGSFPKTEDREGTFPSDICYIYGSGGDIFYMKYDEPGAVYLYDIGAKSSSRYIDAVGKDKKIGALCASGDCAVWEEENIPESDEGNLEREFKIYLRKSDKTIMVDEGKGGETPSALSLFGDSLVYRTYGKVPGTVEDGVLIKLYDLPSGNGKIIFSVAYQDGVEVSQPYAYGDCVVWSVCSADQWGGGDIRSGDVYVYSKKAGMYRKVREGEKLSGPMIWKNYIVCKRWDGKDNALVAFDIDGGTPDQIVSSSMSSFPPREIYDYSVGEGYVTWNNSYLDSVSVYDIANRKKYELKGVSSDKGSRDSLLNVRIYGSTVLYRDHVYDSVSGKTLSETGNYIILK